MNGISEKIKILINETGEYQNLLLEYKRAPYNFVMKNMYKSKWYDLNKLNERYGGGKSLDKAAAAMIKLPPNFKFLDRSAQLYFSMLGDYKLHRDNYIGNIYSSKGQRLMTLNNKYGKGKTIDKAAADYRVVSPTLSGDMIDTQYAASRLGNYSGMGDYSASWINGAVQQILNEQQARVGRFLTYKQKLYDLAGRASSIKSVDSTRGTSLLGRVSSAQNNQSLLESRGLDLLGTIANIKNNPIVKILTNTDVNQSDLSTDLIARGSEIISNLRSSISASASLNSELSKHEKTVNQIESDTNSIEGDLAGRGIFRQAGAAGKSLLTSVTDVTKYIGIAAVAGLGLYVLISKRK